MADDEVQCHDGVTTVCGLEVLSVISRLCVSCTVPVVAVARSIIECSGRVVVDSEVESDGGVAAVCRLEVLYIPGKGLQQQSILSG